MIKRMEREIEKYKEEKLEKIELLKEEIQEEKKKERKKEREDREEEQKPRDEQGEVIEKETERRKAEPVRKPKNIEEEEWNKIMSYTKKKLARAIKNTKTMKKKQEAETRREIYTKLYKWRTTEEGETLLERGIKQIREKWKIQKRKIRQYQERYQKIQERGGEPEKDRVLKEQKKHIKTEIRKIEKKWVWRMEEAEGTGQIRKIRHEKQKWERERGRVWRRWVEETREEEKWIDIAGRTEAVTEIICPKGKKLTGRWRKETDAEKTLAREIAKKIEEIREIERKQDQEGEEGEKGYIGEKLTKEKEVKKLERAKEKKIKEKDEDFWRREIKEATWGKIDPTKELFGIIKRMTTEGTKRKQKQNITFEHKTTTGTGPSKETVVEKISGKEDIAAHFKERIKQQFVEEDKGMRDTDEKWEEIKKAYEEGKYEETGRRKITEEQAEILRRDLTLEDYTKAIKRLKIGKASGPDRLIGEVFRCHPEYWAKIFMKMEKGDIGALADGWVAWLYKKGKRTDRMNYRPVTVLNTAYKAITAAYGEKLNILLGALSIRQFGFKAKSGCRDYLNVVKATMRSNKGKELSIGLMDMSLAFDRARRTKIWEGIMKLGAPIEFAEKIRGLFRETKMRAYWDGALAGAEETDMGVF